MKTRVLKFPRLKVSLCDSVVVFVNKNTRPDLNAVFELTFELIFVLKFLNTKANCFAILKPPFYKVLSIITTKYVISSRRGYNSAVLPVEFTIKKSAVRH